jgi:type I restriction enzyme S subunit
MITKDAIENHSFLLPPPVEQKAIAHILGTLDDKIELNRKTNETLEAMVKALFKSWFVDFDPVRAKAEGRPTGLPAEISDLFPDSFEDSELGEIPSGWEVQELGEISTISGGKQLEAGKLMSKGRFPVYGANGVMGFHEQTTHDSFVIVFGRVGAYCGSVKWEYGGAWVNNNASSVIPLKNKELVLQSMLEADFSNYRTGSAQPFIPNGALASSPVLMPTDAVATLFCDSIKSIRLNQKQNESIVLSLVEIRDALLPKLISGEIRIPDAEKMLEEVGI